MKLMKLTAIICVLALLAGVFSVIPVSAFSNAEYESEVWNLGGSTTTLSGWRSEPTVSGYDDYLNFYPPYYVVSRNQYDLNTTKVRVNSVTIPSGQWASMTFSPDGISGTHRNSDPANGLVCLLLKKDSSGNLVISRYQDSAENAVFTVPAADTYEFEFIKRATASGSSSTYQYVFRVNEKYYQTNSTASWLVKFMKAQSFSSSHINLGASSRLIANVKLAQKGVFSTSYTSPLYYDDAADGDGYQKIYAKDSSYSVATTKKHNMTKEALVLKNISLDTSSSLKLNFSTLYRFDQASPYATNSNLGLVIKKDASNKITVSVVGASGSETALTAFTLKNPLEIMFVDDGASGYGLMVCGYYFENSDITAFLAAASGEDCYVSVSAVGTFEAEAKFSSNAMPIWVTDSWKSAITTSTSENGQTVYTLPWQTTLTSTEKFNAFKSYVVLENANFGTSQKAVVLGFSNKHIGYTRGNDAANGKLIFDVYTQNDSSGKCTGLRVHTAGGSQLGDLVAPAESYYISLCEIDGKYYLKINDSLFTSSSITTFCQSFADSVHFTISPYNSTMQYSLDIWDLGPGFSVDSDIYAVTKQAVSLIKPYSSANDIIKKLKITNGYELKVQTVNGDDRTFADLLATDDKLVVTYKERDVASFDISVGGDLNGDAKIAADDIVLLRKQLLGVSGLTGVYDTAGDVNCDGKRNILDYVAIGKTVIENQNRTAELLGLVDFAVEVESGREPVVLQITDTLVLDSEQARNDGVLSDYQTEVWKADKASENCYAYITEMVNETKPDLIVISGNMVWGEYDDNGTVFQGFVQFMDSFNIPWAPVFGEHDNESAMGVDWQCDVLEAAENCLFKQRNLTGNGNYTVGLFQNNKLLRVFYMLDSNGCKKASESSLSNNHTKTAAGFGSDQIEWYQKLIAKTQKTSQDTKISFVYGIQQSVFGDAFLKYGFDNTATQIAINLNKTPSCENGDFGYIGAKLNGAWDTDNKIFNDIKSLGVDSILSGGESANSASVLYDGIRFQYGQKSSTYGYCNNVLNDGTVKALYPEENGYTPLVGGTVIPVDSMDGSINKSYIYYCDEAGGNINFAKAATLYVKDFGAVGDGVTDDGNAVYDAMEAFMKCGAGSKLVFENKTYYIADNSDRHNRALNFKNMYNSSVEGNGATILIGGETVYMTVSNCQDFEINGLNFDRKIRSHFVGTVTSNPLFNGYKYIEITADRDIGFTDSVYDPTDMIFAFGLNNGVVKRTYIYMDKLEAVDAANGKYRFYPDQNDTQLNTMTNFKKLTKGSQIVIPTPNIGHRMDDDFVLTGNSDLTLKNVNVYNGADFVFNVTSNSGDITFDSVNIAAPEDETTKFVTWRDGFHCKFNRGALTWRNCKAVGLGDDIINISCYMMNVGEVISDNELKCNWDLKDGSYGYVPEGSLVEIYDVDTGKLIGETTIKSVVNQAENHYILSDSLTGLTAGENIRFNIISDAAPNSLITGCDFEGTIRFKGAGGVVENSKLNLYAMMMYPETTVEGPIPRDTVFRNCDFTGTWTGRIEITCLSPVTEWQEGYYRLKNIKFDSCTGLTKAMFKHSGNFDENSVDYIEIVNCGF